MGKKSWITYNLYVCLVVNRPIVIATARGIVINKEKSLLLSDFGGPIDLSKSWTQSFLRRLGYVKREGTKAARKVPDDFKFIKMEFLSEIQKLVKTYDVPDDYFDQINVMIIPVRDYTFYQIRSKQISIMGLEDKSQVTVVLACTLSGNLSGKNGLVPPEIQIS